MPNIENTIKLFGMSNQLILSELTAVEKKYQIELGHNGSSKNDKDNSYYPQFELAIRSEAGVMSEHYETFYCLEKAIRSIITDTMEAEKGSEWWSNENVPTQIVDVVKGRIDKETDSGVTRRSDAPIDYTTFGELGEIIKKNWEVFGAIFNRQKAVENVMSRLNTLRAPIAHCTSLAEDEVKRLQVSVGDWFRLME